MDGNMISSVLYPVFLWICTGAVVTSILLIPSKKLNLNFYWSLLIFSIPFSLSLLNVLVLHSYTPDEQEFFQSGWYIAESLRGGTIPEWNFRNLRVGIYSWIVGITFSIAGNQRVVILALNSGFWGLSGVFWMRIAKDLFDRVPIYTPILLMFYPAGVIWAFQNVRDSITIFLISIVLWLYIQWAKENHLRYLGLFGFGLALLLILRTEMLFVVVVAFLIAESVSISENSRKFISYSLPFILFVFLLGYVLVSVAEDSLPYIDALNIDFLEGRRSNRAEVAYSYLSDMNYSSWLDVLLYLPIRVAYLILSPFPWNLTDVGALWKQYVDSLYLSGIFVLLLLFSRSILNSLKKEHIFILSYALLVIAGYSIVISDYGAAYRRRYYAIPVILLFLSEQIERRIVLKY